MVTAIRFRAALGQQMLHVTFSMRLRRESISTCVWRRWSVALFTSTNRAA